MLVMPVKPYLLPLALPWVLSACLTHFWTARR